ncbi:MAG TPA: 4Fe-4S binding protein [Fodinibius sp.]|nr:4Fe-4S binding protein [Fodinibius sp.]
MAYVVAEPCINCKYTHCASVCPVDAFREGPNFLVIDPIDCIDCDACVMECPVDAIFPVAEVPLEWEHYIDLNDRLSEQWSDQHIWETTDPMENADEWAEKEDKDNHLQEVWE